MHDWCARDINQALIDWRSVGNWLPANPHRPIGLLRTILKPLDLAERPAAADMAREEQELAATRARIAANHAAFKAAQDQRAAAIAAYPNMGGRRAAIAIAEAAALRARDREAVARGKEAANRKVSTDKQRGRFER